MSKKVFSNTTLACNLQDGSEIKENYCLHGLLTPMGSSFRFEEEIKQPAKPYRRNPKIFDGEFISLVRKEDNSIQFSFKSSKANFDPENFAFNVYSEVVKAINKIKA